jgi:hypothetical protein
MESAGELRYKAAVIGGLSFAYQTGEVPGVSNDVGSRENVAADA